nr:hypothetical protein [uncultured Acetatifactor sp.]
MALAAEREAEKAEVADESAEKGDNEGCQKQDRRRPGQLLRQEMPVSAAGKGGSQLSGIRDDAPSAEAHVDFREVSMCCNFGARQEVKQVHFHVLSREALAEKADEETESFEMEGRKACFSSRGNAYMDVADLACAAFVRKAFSEEKSRRPGGFSLIWRLGQWG